MRYSLMFRWNKLIGKREHGAETMWKCLDHFYLVPKQYYDVAIAYQQGLPTYLVAKKIRALKKIAWVNVNIFNAGYNSDFNSNYYDKMDCIVPVSNDLESILREIYSQFTNKYVCIYDILNAELIRKQALVPFSEKDLFHKKITLVTVGRLAPQKNHLLAVDAAKFLKDSGIDFYWFFIGEGSERPKIEQRINMLGLGDTVSLLGMRTNPYPYIANCTIYVQTSSFEGFGLTIAEAKILHKPVVSTNFDVVHDQLTHEYNGLIAEMTAESVAKQICRLLTHASLLEHIMENVSREENTTYLTEIIKAEQIFDAN